MLGPDRVLTIPDELIIRAEIINGGMKKENVSTRRQKTTAVVNQQSQVISQGSNDNSPDKTKKKDKEHVSDALDSSSIYLIDKPEVIKTSSSSVNATTNPYITSDKGTQINNYQPAHVKDLLRIIRDSIEKAKVYPLLARKKGIEGKVSLKFRIRHDGKVEEIRIIKSSGSEILDKTSVETIKIAAPFPYIAGWIEIPIAFRLE